MVTAECTAIEAFQHAGENIVFGSGSPFDNVDLGTLLILPTINNFCIRKLSYFLNLIKERACYFSIVFRILFRVEDEVMRDHSNQCHILRLYDEYQICSIYCRKWENRSCESSQQHVPLSRVCTLY